MIVKNYNIHTTFLTAVGILGGSVLAVPFLKCENPVLTFLLCAMLTFFAVAAVLPLVNRMLNSKGISVYLASAVIMAFALYGAVVSVTDYMSFLLQDGGFFKLLLFILVVASLTFCGNNAFLKFALLFGSVAVFFTVLLFFASAGIYNVNNIDLTPLKIDFKTVILSFLKYFSVCLATIAFCTLTKKQARRCAVLSGVGIGAVTAAVCLMQGLLVLGGTASGYTHPYLAAVSAFSSGQLYIRQDGFVWFIFFSTAIIKTALCTKAVWVIIKRMSMNN